MMRKAKLIETIVASAIGVAVVIAVTVIMTTSYSAWKTAFDAATEAMKPELKKVLVSIDAELVEGKEYFDNNLASVKNEDVKVTANYKLGDETFSERVEDAQAYTLSVPADFATNGGDITVTYGKKKTSFNVALRAVELESLDIVQNPYTVAYKTGATFADTGMIVYAVYNDGSRKQITIADYDVDKITPLTDADTYRTLSYTEGEITETVDIPITVSENFKNGRAVSLSTAEDVTYASVGSDIADVRPRMKVTFESGNSLPIGNDAFEVKNKSESIRFGKAYDLEVVYKGDSRLVTTVPVTARYHVEAETLPFVGSEITNTKAEAEYVFENGTLTATGNKVTFLGNFQKAVGYKEESSFTMPVEVISDCVSDITMRCSNSYCVTDDFGAYWMMPLQINTVLDMTVNGEPVPIGNNVVLKGCGPNATYAPLFGVYYEFTFEDIALKAGSNNVKFTFKASTEGARDCWDNALATMNVDWLNVDIGGTKFDENADIAAIEIDDKYVIRYGAVAADIIPEIPVIATLENGTRVMLDKSLYTVELTGGELEPDGTFFIGDYVFTATLVDGGSTGQATLTVAEYYEILVRTADIVEENGRAYYILGFDMIGYTAEDLELFNGTDTYEFTFVPDHKTALIKVDVTDFEAGASDGDPQLIPHLRVKGENYVNGANKNGDVRGDSLVFTNGKSITLVNKVYAIKTVWSMPGLYVTAVA